MDVEKVDQYLMMSAKFFPENQLPFIRRALLGANEAQFSNVQFLQYKDPTIALILSLLAGTLGADRFYLGQVGLGLLKLFTCGGATLWALVDIFLIMGTTKEENMARLFQVLHLR
ncbi:TM2 domain-containing protein [Porphyromonas cangingivalis]|uniref:TM2 domain-containing protein n=1 Tax=Porphyromonas cangingivalis TaxID=36874 RepID=UPI00051D71C5|nr:TM2 domain-containing protein [Porphyromonas cangingivalis]KGL50174.1 hypothetical protein HQ34_00585 [Porphyromonas cangingivalis]